ncbi:hypothetical protein FB45DRAFT_932185 [Roridomyces roridus]|uniref:Novel STAND NTPase 1 domain-containing protein n=1 Tax=Roridomyces roridus TaxID=1738132 RepID=A0AAD7BEE9_9AGAR|nr:hypothetical protein FB45DRAFT_932185 [Roridomyces roridus]
MKDIIEYTKLAASTIKEIADAAETPFLALTASLTMAILGSFEAEKSNMDRWAATTKQIHEILCIIVTLHTKSSVLSHAMLFAIKEFTNTLQQLLASIKIQQGMGKIKQLFRQATITSRLEACKSTLKGNLETFRAFLQAHLGHEVDQLSTAAEDYHKQLLTLISSSLPMVDSDHSTSVTGTLSNFTTSTSSLSLIPSAPHIFHGRELELQKIVKTLMGEHARIAILGTGGMGKTSLALAALHQHEITAKYSQQHFIACHSVKNCTQLLSLVASHVGLEAGRPRASRRIADYFMAKPHTLLILDNFETPWESTESRSEVEDFLSLLGEVPQLAIIITMRGTERPAKMKWSRPFLGPLKTLSESEAHQIFSDIAGTLHNDEQVKALLDLTGNLPLAVSLMANVASYESCESILAQWKTSSTTLLTAGSDTTSSLDISIQLSFESPRMTADARNLLSLLSLLPDGLSDSELVQSELPIPDILSTKITLLQTSLAYMDNTRRIKVLVPIQECITRVAPPSEAMKFAFRQHIHALLQLGSSMPSGGMGSPEFLAQASPNLGNISSILSDTLHRECPDEIKNIRSIINFNTVFRMKNGGPSPLMLQLDKSINCWKGEKIHREYLLEIIYSAPHYMDLLNMEEKIEAGNQAHQAAPEEEQARWYYGLGLHYQNVVHDLARALEYQKALLDLKGLQDFSTIGHAWRLLASIMEIMGRHAEARTSSTKAREYLELTDDLHGQAQALLIELRACYSLGDFAEAGRLCSKAQGLLEDCGLQSGTTAKTVQNHKAEIHLLKTEYLAAQKINLTLLDSLAGNPSPSTDRAYAHINLALIEIATISDSASVNAHLEAARAEFTRYHYTPGFEHCDIVVADLHLAEKNYVQGRKALLECLAAPKAVDETVMFCMERLADFSYGMNDLSTTLNWTVVYLGLALKSKNLLHIMKSFRCLGDIFVGQGDEATAFSLFNIALDGFNFMDIHQCKADCMFRIAGILEHRGQNTTAAEVLYKARPLFERSSQLKDVAKVDAKLAALDSAESPRITSEATAGVEVQPIAV